METARDLLMSKDNTNPGQFLTGVIEENTGSTKNLHKVNKPEWHDSSTRIKTLTHSKVSSRDRESKIERRMKSVGTINRAASIVSPSKFTRTVV